MFLSTFVNFFKKEEFLSFSTIIILLLFQAKSNKIGKMWDEIYIDFGEIKFSLLVEFGLCEFQYSNI